MIIDEIRSSEYEAFREVYLIEMAIEGGDMRILGDWSTFYQVGMNHVINGNSMVVTEICRTVLGILIADINEWWRKGK